MKTSNIILAAVLATLLSGCGIVTAASAVVGTAASVAGTVVTTAVDIGAGAVKAVVPGQ